MTRPVTTAELLLQQIADSNAEIVDLLRQGPGQPAPAEDATPAPDAPTPAPDATPRRPGKKTPRPRKGTEVRGD